MVKKALFILTAAIFLTAPLSAMMCGSDAGSADHSGHSMVTADEQKCPVSGEAIPKDSNVTYEYKGKVYKFCCPACIDEFKKNPEKYTGGGGHES